MFPSSNPFSSLSGGTDENLDYHLDIAAILSFSLCGLFTLVTVLALLRSQESVLPGCRHRDLLALPAADGADNSDDHEDDKGSSEEGGQAATATPATATPATEAPSSPGKLFFTEIRSSRRLTFHEHREAEKWENRPGRRGEDAADADAPAGSHSGTKN